MMKLTTRFALAVLLASCGGNQTKPAPENKAVRADTPAENPSEVAEAHEAQHRAEQARDEAVKARDEAVKAAIEVQEKVERIEKDLADLDKRLSTAVDTIGAAQSDADRAAANAKLEQLRKDKAEMEARIAKAKAAAVRARNK